MTPRDFVALLPLMVLLSGSVVVMLAAAFARRHRLIAALSAMVQVLALGSLFVAAPVAPRPVTELLMVDSYALFYMGLMLLAGIAVTLLSVGYWDSRTGVHEEYYALLLLATTGACILVGATHFASFFLGLELLTVSLYTLIAYQRDSRGGIEAGVKYLVLAGISSAFLLLGMALVYAAYGTMSFARMASEPSGHDVLVLAGLGLILVGVGFKLALAPFHLWTPDVYQAAPAPATAYVATVSKGAMFALLLRLMHVVDLHAHGSLVVALSVIAIASMLVGNLQALMQESVKRLLANSSIAHLGYLLVALLASGPLAGTAVTLYLVAYFITMLGAFGVVSALSSGGREADDLFWYRGLFWRRPVLAAILSAMLLSLAGIPLTAGFIGKFYVLAAGIDSRLYSAVGVLVVSSALGLFYYLRIMIALYRSPREARISATEPPQERMSWTGVLTLVVLCALLVGIGTFPSAALMLIKKTLGAAAF